MSRTDEEQSAPQDSASLSFGTAGLRAPIGPGPADMNVSTVTRTSAGVAAWLQEHRTPISRDGRYRVAVGYDARYGSQQMAHAAAETFAGAGAVVTLIAEPAPTPVLAWLVKDREMDAGVQITASHNPPGDNGYKLYLAGGSQLTSPADRQIEEAIAAQPPADQAWRIPRSEAKSVDQSVVAGYVSAISALVASGDQKVLKPRRKLKVLYTPMHGVGGNAIEWALREAGFAQVHSVPSQRWPDPTFPTVDFPNPEESGATDELLAEAERLSADLLIALDPDADRCMIGVPVRARAQGESVQRRQDTQADEKAVAKSYRMFSGDEAGALLATRVLAKWGYGEQGESSRSRYPAPVVANTIVSSQLLGRIAAARGWDHQETLTGFKHLARAADSRPGELVFAYEEAIGTCPAPHVVADKDGVTTALIAAAWAAELADGPEPRTLLDEWEALEEEFGVFRTAQVSVRFDTVDKAAELVDRLVASPPQDLAGIPVQAVPLDGTAGLRLSGASVEGGEAVQIRIIVRPSGTEPKTKFYLEASGAPGGSSTVVSQTLERLILSVKELQATIK